MEKDNVCTICRERYKFNGYYLCDKCFDKFADDYLIKDREKMQEFENKKNSMKYLYEAFYRADYKGEKGKNTEINLRIDIYSDKKLTKMERHWQIESTRSKILVLIKQILSAEKGSVILNVETYILPTIVESDKKITSKRTTRDLGKIKPKKNLIIMITKY